MKTYSLEDLTDKYIGKKGTKKRDDFENELRLDLLGQAIKQARQERNLTGTIRRTRGSEKSSNFEN